MMQDIFSGHIQPDRYDSWEEKHNEYHFYDPDWLKMEGDLDDFIFYGDMEKHISER